MRIAGRRGPNYAATWNARRNDLAFTGGSLCVPTIRGIPLTRETKTAGLSGALRTSLRAMALISRLYLSLPVL